MAKNVCMGIVWFLIFLLLSFLVGGFCLIFYVLLYTCQGFKCCECLKEITEFLKKGVEFPNMCAENCSKNCGC